MVPHAFLLWLLVMPPGKIIHIVLHGDKYLILFLASPLSPMSISPRSLVLLTYETAPSCTADEFRKFGLSELYFALILNICRILMRLDRPIDSSAWLPNRPSSSPTTF